MDTRKQTGEPYLFFVDHANRALPEPQKKKGLKVRQSNLCVGPLTELLTSGGYKPIGASGGPGRRGLERHGVVDDHGELTGVEQEVMRVWFEDGSHLDVTP
jgi:ribonucleoside-diphosphate reductase alpha chain